MCPAPKGTDVRFLKTTLVAALFLFACAADAHPSGGPAVPAGRPGRFSDKRPRHAGPIVLATVHDEHPPGDDHRHHDHTSHPAKPPADTESDHSHEPAPGHWPLILLGLYCLAIIGASLLGGWLPQLMNLTHNRMQIFISLIGGFMLGIGVFHMLPHALVELGDRGPDLAAYGMVGGLVVMFLLLRVFHFHHHGPTEVVCRHDHEAAEHAHSHDHDHDHDHHHVTVSGNGDRSLSWVGIFLGMALHTLIDGLALGASVEADALHGATGLLGLGTFLAVLLHKPLDSVSITSVMAAGGWSPASRTLVNAAFSLICPLGAVLFVIGMGNLAEQQSLVVGCALAVSAGVFLCIALSDLLPEMEFHSHSRLPLTAALLTGVALAWAIGFAESEHAHSHRHVESHK
jgi:zinc and cadmium transporter